MGGTNAGSGDEMIRRLETELKEKQTFCQEIFARAQAASRDLSDEDKTLVSEARGRMEVIKGQLDTIEDVSRVSHESSQRARQVGQAIDRMRGQRDATTNVEYRSAGSYILDMWQSAQGSRDATDRLEFFHRAAEHQKTPDNPGLIPDPIIGPVINFIDAARPLVSALGPQNLPGATWHRPVVTQHTAVGPQGSAGKLGTDEKAELVSQKLIIGRLTGEAKTYGGYVNVSRQNIDFSNPQVLDIIVQDLAAQYAIDTEAATGKELADGANGPTVSYDVSDPETAQQSVAAAVWEGAGKAYTAVRGQGRLLLVVAPDVLGAFGPLFAPYGPMNQQGTGFLASSFAQGIMGTISGVSVVMSTGLGEGEAFLLSSAALEVYEQRIGTLQVTEPSVLGVQIAYAGYFTSLLINKDAIIPLEGSGG